MIKALLINALLRQLLDPYTRARLMRLVQTMANVDMTGPEKRDYVIREMAGLGMGVADWVLNLALELAVARLRS